MYSNGNEDTSRKGFSKKDRLYRVADTTWTVAAWIWSTVIIVFLVSFAAGLAITINPQNYLFQQVLDGLKNPNTNPKLEILRITTLSALILFIIITLLSVILRQLLKKQATTTEAQELLSLVKMNMEEVQKQEAAKKANDEEGFMHYLRSMKEMNQNISPEGLAQHSRTLVFTDVPLDRVFVPLHVIPDRPVFDIPDEQQRQLKKMLQRTDLSGQERDDYIQRLRFTWYSQLQQEKAQIQQQIPVDEVLRRFSSGNPVAVILGSPGSGKTTFLHWVAYHLALSLISSDRSSPAKGSAPARFPILIRISDYAERLAKEHITLRQFLIMQLGEIHPNAVAKALDELEHGHCLIMFDGLDGCLSSQMHRHIIDAIHSFIIDHSVDDPQTHQTNNFIITSRIADYKPEVFTKYAHYTLSELDDRQIEQFLAQWCSAIESDLLASGRGTQHQSERELLEMGIKHQERLRSVLIASPGLKRLAANPLALTMMAFIQANDKDLLRYRFDLYKLVTRTLLDTWNQGSGRKIFSAEEISLVEDALGRFADCLQRDEGLLSSYDVELIARQALAEFYHLQVHEVKDNDVAQLIEKLRRSSGVFAEVGDDLFCFANQAFQDFYAALYLLRRPREERRQLAVKHALSIKWSEPLLLVLMYKNTRSSRDEQKETIEILQAILDSPGDNSAIAQHNLLLILSSIVDGRLLITDQALRERIRSSAERIAQQQSPQITAEQRNLIMSLLQQFDSQIISTETPTHPL
jgi:hypothetical protein